ncbi:26718_t:CDS:2, partial [Racocetra persica]
SFDYENMDQSNFDNENEIDYSNTQLNEFGNHNDSINMVETSSHTEIIENSLQEYRLSTNDRSDDYNNSDSSIQSDQNNNSEWDGHDIYEEVDFSEETDNEDYERITPSSLLN